jgi:hypothetical protein
MVLHTKSMSKMICQKSFIRSTQGTVFTILYFLCNLLMGPKAGVLHYTRLKKLGSDKHSTILGKFLSYEENEVL